MNAIGNILFFVLGGFVITLGYLIGGLLLCLTIIGIPFGVQAFKLAGATMAPFGTRVTEKPNAQGCTAVVLNIIWVILPGLELAIIHLVLGVLFGITIIGIPFAKQHFKLAPLALFPFGRRLESVD